MTGAAIIRVAIRMTVPPVLAAMSIVLQARGATLLVCRAFDLAMPPLRPLVVPEGSIFRDDGRADDPLAALGNDRWQLRIVTATDALIPALQPCARVQARIASDSSVKFVSVANNRNLIYAGSYLLLDRPDESEELLTTRGRVLDQVP